MKKISLNGISEILSEKELKNVMGGSGDDKCTTEGCQKNVECTITHDSHTYKGKCRTEPYTGTCYCNLNV